MPYLKIDTISHKKTMKKLTISLLGAFLISLIPSATANAVFEFTDVKNNPYESSIYLLYDIAVIDGNPDGSFAPKRTLNRAEFAKIMVNFVYFEEIEQPTEKCFEDVPLDAWYAPYVCKAKELGIVKGDKGEGKIYRPAATLNLAECLAALSNAFEWYPYSPAAGEQWFDPLYARAQELNVLDQNFAVTSSPTREIFSDIAARSVVVYDMYLDKFTGYDDYFDYYDLLAGNFTSDQEEKIEEIQDELVNSETDTTSYTDKDEENYIKLVTYEINEDDTLGTANKGKNVPSQYQSWQSDTEKHQEIWAYFSKLFPRRYREHLTQFEIYSDGEYETLGYMDHSDNVPNEWKLKIDIVDSYREEFPASDFQFTLIHEFAHLLNFAPDQFDHYEDMYAASMKDNTSQEFNDIYTKRFNECWPNFFFYEGCTLNGSYLNTFFNKFWDEDLYNEWIDILYLNENAKVTALTDLYYENTDRFVGEYAASAPEEDFADTFATFVISEKPSGNKEKDQKVKFFYDYEELVKLKNIVTSRL